MNSPDCATCCGLYSLCFLSLQEERRDSEGFQSIFLSAIEGFDSQELMNLPEQKLRECFGIKSHPVLPVASLTQLFGRAKASPKNCWRGGRQPDPAYPTLNSSEINLVCSTKPLATFQLGELRPDPGIQKEIWKVLWNASSGSITSCHKNHSKINDITEKRQKSKLFLYIFILSYPEKRNEDVSCRFWLQSGPESSGVRNRSLREILLESNLELWNIQKPVWGTWKAMCKSHLTGFHLNKLSLFPWLFDTTPVTCSRWNPRKSEVSTSPVPQSTRWNQWRLSWKWCHLLGLVALFLASSLLRTSED